MDKDTFAKRSRYRFLLLSFLLVVLLASLLVASFRSSNTDNLNTIITELSSDREGAAQVENAIKLLYSAENNFRTFVLTGNKANYKEYSGEIRRIADIFLGIEHNYQDLESLPGLFKNKKEKTDIFIRARLLADSLMKNSVTWDTTTIYTGLYTEQMPPKSLIVSRVDTIISSGQAPGAKRKLFGRIRDAIKNKPEESNKNEVKVVRSTVNSTETFDKSKGSVHKIPGATIADLRAMTLSLKRKEFELLESNNKLFAEMKDFLEGLRELETKMALQRKESLGNNADLNLRSLSAYNKWQLAVILLLVGCVLATLYWIYKNDLNLIQETKKANLYAKLKTEFVSTASHEIRSPIYVMQLYAEQLIQENLPDYQQRIVQGLTNSAKLTLAIVNNILDTIEVDGKKIELKKELFQPDKTIAEVITSLAVFSDNKCIVLKSESLLPTDFQVIGDEFRLKQILINLVSNAFKFTIKGQILVRSSIVSDSAIDQIRLKISVEDTGVGISEENLQTVFQQFAYLNISRETDAQMKSNGLGLYIIKKIIDEHQGKIYVESTLGAGTIFTLEIPYQKANSRKFEGSVSVS